AIPPRVRARPARAGADRQQAALRGQVHREKYSQGQFLPEQQLPIRHAPDGQVALVAWRVTDADQVLAVAREADAVDPAGVRGFRLEVRVDEVAHHLPV